jgi:hypothetical protein
MVDILPVGQEPAEDQTEPADRPILTTEMLRREREAVARLRNKPVTDPVWLGLALSGGGIRSASFALGLMQGLHGAGVMKRFDYLSTVSGGGYIGASLSYFLNRRAAGAHPRTDFWFPFGHAWQTGARGDRTFLEPQQARPQEAEDERRARLIVSFIRQHAHYLTPTPRLGPAALIANALRAMLFSLGLYFAIIVLVLMLSFDLGNSKGWLYGHLLEVSPWLADVFSRVIAYLSGFAPHCPETLAPQECHYPPPSLFWSLGTIGALAFVLLMLAYSLYSALASRGSESIQENAADNFYRGFTLRVTGWLGKLLLFEVVCLVLATLPWTYGWAEREADGKLIGAVSVAIAYVGTWREKHEALLGKLTKLEIWQKIWPYLYAGLAIYGILFLAYGVGELLWGMAPVYLFIAILFFGTVVNINLVSQHRMYRDRLMEAMCPNMGAVEAGKWQAATDANVLELDQLAGGADSRVPPTGIAPYHLINTALIIPASKKPKYSGRGADSFVFSANWSGSDATHWAPSHKYMGGHMTLPTAMAISGAALNAHAGPDGRGVLRSSLAVNAASRSAE